MNASELRIKEFGNTVYQLRSVCIFGVILALIAEGIFAGAAYNSGNLDRVWNTLPCALLIGVTVPLLILPTCLFSIRVTRDKIQHLFCRKWHLSEGLIEDLTSVEIGKPLVVFRFKNGPAIRFIGAHLRILEALCLCIQEHRPAFANFNFENRTALTLGVLHKLNPNGHEPTHHDSRF